MRSAFMATPAFVVEKNLRIFGQRFVWIVTGHTGHRAFRSYKTGAQLQTFGV